MSSSRRMLTTTAAPDRTIQNLPQPYSESSTPYKQIGFNHKVKSACNARSTSPRLGKCVLVGDISVGKTSLVNRFAHQVFDRDYKATIGVDFEVERFSILGTPFNLQIWDTAGAERFKCIAASYYRGANCVITVFDLACPASLENSRKWMLDACENAEDCLRFLVGSKADLVSEQIFLEMELRGKEVAHDLQAEFWTVSSLTGQRVREFFARVSALTFERCVQRESESGPGREIGGSLMVSEETDVYEKKENPLNCCA